VSAHVRAIEERHPKLDAALLHERKQALPHAEA